jgi:carbonic anhydrase
MANVGLPFSGSLGDFSMCVVCDVNLARRGFLSLVGAGVAASLLPSSVLAAGGPTTSLTADQALAKLKEGNAKYVSSPQLCEVDLANSREHVSKGQAP